MQPKVIEDIYFEINRIENLFNKYNQLLEKIKNQDPDFIELGSLAMFLHSFYNGLENIFSRIARKIDKDMPSGENWHNDLLDLMIQNSTNRPYSVLKSETAEELKEFLGFRHFSRHAYAFDLDWNLTKDLVLKADETRKKVLEDLKTFLEKYN